MRKKPLDTVILAVYIFVSIILIGGSIYYIENKSPEIHEAEAAMKVETELLKGIMTSKTEEQPDVVTPEMPYIRIPRHGEDTVLYLENNYMDKVFDVTINKWDDEVLTVNDIARFTDNKVYYGKPQKYSPDFVKKIKIALNEEENPGFRSINLRFTLDHVYEPGIITDDEYFYISVNRPKEVYEQVVVIDAGHGGSSSGTYSESSTMFEKDINLDVVLKLKEYMDKLEKESRGRLKVYYTRLTDDNIYLVPRVGLANDVMADAFISIHCNGNYDTSIYGAELDCPPEGKECEKKSAELGKTCYESMLEKTGICDGERYVRDDIYILAESEVPSCLLEMGYLTNKKERKYLEKDINRQAAADGIYEGLVKYLGAAGSGK